MGANSTGGSTTGVDTTGSIPNNCDEVDIPDINGLDENGDGIDGLADCAVYVDGAVGSDLNDGLTLDDPVATIQHGIDVAQTFNPPRMVLVAAGEYVETINLNSGVSVYGGYEPDDWDRNVVANVTEITGDAPRTVIAQNLDEAVEVDGFTVNAMSYAIGGESTYGIWVRDTPEGLLAVDYCIVNAGDGGAGEDGDNGSNGEDGENGDNAVDGTPGAGGASACNATGGNGGSGQACPATDGIDGSAGGDSTTVGQGGPAGASECAGNTCNDSGNDGSPGLAGHAGVNGDGGSAPNDNAGSFGGNGLWTGPQGVDARRGDHGSGGGGGGAGGYDVDSGIWCTFYDGEGIGGGGGGGGSGGCGGEAGGTGQPGGGSFGIVAVDSSVDVSNTDIFLGTGGDGGDGGTGGHGGVPGSNGFGDQGIDNGGEPGNGADGNGGGGGGGGGGGVGGCGGASVGIAEVGTTSVSINNVSFSGGAGGNPGVGGDGGIRADGLNLQAPGGEDGCDGLHADEHTW